MDYHIKNIPEYTDIINIKFIDPSPFMMYWWYIPSSTGISFNDGSLDISLSEEAEDKCTCPAVNFSWNGIGCKCGQIERERARNSSAAV
jgi:hypothetical protein